MYKLAYLQIYSTCLAPGEFFNQMWITWSWFTSCGLAGLLASIRICMHLCYQHGSWTYSTSTLQKFEGKKCPRKYSLFVDEFFSDLESKSYSDFIDRGSTQTFSHYLQQNHPAPSVTGMRQLQTRCVNRKESLVLNWTKNKNFKGCWDRGMFDEQNMTMH